MGLPGHMCGNDQTEKWDAQEGLPEEGYEGCRLKSDGI